MNGTVHVCPLCHELAGYSDDWGWSLYCSHDPYESVEPVEVTGEVRDGAWVFPLPDPEEWKRTVGAEMLAKQEERDRKRAEWVALSCEERQEIREKQREANPTVFAMGEVMRGLPSLLSRQVYGSPKTIRHTCPKCREWECENSWEEPNPDYRDPVDLWTGGFTVKVEPGGAGDAA